MKSNSGEEDRLSVEEAEEVTCLLGHLRPGDPVLRAGVRILRQEPIPSAQPLYHSLEEVHPSRWRGRAAAAWALGRARLTREESQIASSYLIRVLQGRITEGARRYYRWIGRTFAGALVAAAVYYLLLSLTYSDRWGMAAPLWIIPMVTIGVGSLSLVIALPLQAMNERGKHDRVRAEGGEGARPPGPPPRPSARFPNASSMLISP